MNIVSIQHGLRIGCHVEYFDCYLVKLQLFILRKLGKLVSQHVPELATYH